MEKIEKDLQQFRANMMAIKEKMITPVMGSREMSLVMTKIQEAQMHFGNALGFFTSKDPYIKSDLSGTDEIIEVHRDSLTKPFEIPAEFMLEGTSRIQKIKLIRVELDVVINRIMTLTHIYSSFLDEWTKISIMIAGIRVKECKNWLGEELGQIRDKPQPKPTGVTIGKVDISEMTEGQLKEFYRDKV